MHCAPPTDDDRVQGSRPDTQHAEIESRPCPANRFELRAALNSRSGKHDVFARKTVGMDFVVRMMIGFAILSIGLLPRTLASAARKWLFIAALCVSCLSAQTYRTNTSNFAYELKGTANGGPGLWGAATSYQNLIVFHPPPGYHVRILWLSGDVVAWPSQNIRVPDGTRVEIGWGLKDTGPDITPDVNYDNSSATPYRGTFLWLQGELDWINQYLRLPFDRQINVVLGSDNAMVCQPFVALDTTGVAIHIEPTFTFTYVYEPEDQAAAANALQTSAGK